MHHYPFHPGDYLLDTAHLGPMHDLAYRRLLDLYYTSEAPIPLETQRVSTRLRLDTEVVADVLREFFTETPQGWKQDRCDAVLAAYAAMAKRNKRNGMNGGRPKKTQSVPTGNPVVTQPETRNQEPEPEREDAPAIEVLPRGCSKRKPQGWPSNEAQAREMAENAGADGDVAATYWKHYEGMGYFPQGNFAMMIQAKQGFREQDLADKQRLMPKQRLHGEMTDKNGRKWVATT